MSEDRFAVWVWFPDGTHLCEAEDLDEESAAKKACSLSQNVGARIGTTQRITIVEQKSDDTVFEWTFGKGVTFPVPQLHDDVS
jgi:hypothetical protein